MELSKKTLSSIFMKFFSLIKSAWNDYDNSRKIKDISDISIKVSTNHVYRIILDDGSKIIAKVSAV